MATAAEAAKDFATGPLVLEAARLLLSRVSLPALCEALLNSLPEDTEHILNALLRLSELPETSDGFFVDSVAGFLRQGAESSDPRVRAVVAKLLSRLAVGCGEAGVARLAQYGLLEASEALLMDEDTGVAESAAATLRAIIAHQAWRGAALAAVDRLQQCLAAGGMDDMQRIRVLHLFVELGRTGDDVFKALEDRGAYRRVLESFITDDLLLKLNAVELMDALGSYPAGQEFLSREGVPEQLAQNLSDPYCDDSVRLCVVRLLGLVIRRSEGTLAKLLPGREAPLAQTIAGMLETSGSDTTARLTALNAWANISRHNTGLAFFLQWEGRVSTILGHVSSTNNEVCQGAMSAWAVVLEERAPPIDSGASGSDEAPTMMLWDLALKRVLPAVLKSLVSKPFPDVRFHAWNLLALLVRSRQAAQTVVPSEEMQRILFDFTSETESPARIGKYAFVEALLRYHRGWLVGFLDEPVLALLEEYGKQGPHWVPHASAVTVGDKTG